MNESIRYKFSNKSHVLQSKFVVIKLIRKYFSCFEGV